MSWKNKVKPWFLKKRRKIVGPPADWYRSGPCTHPYLRFKTDGTTICQRCGAPAEAGDGFS